MPSGFQQDLNQLQPNFYRVTIDLAGYPSEAANPGLTTNGGITPNSADSFTVLPTTLGYGKARARGNMRFRNIVSRLTGLSDCQILDITINEANGNAQASTLAFTVKYERDTFIADTKETTIANAVAQGIIDVTTANVRVYNGDDLSEGQMSVTVTSHLANLAAALTDVTITLQDVASLID